VIFWLYFLLKKRKKLQYLIILLVILIPIILLILDYQHYRRGKKLSNILYTDQPKSKIIFLGIDGAEWKIIDGLIKKNLLPNFKYLIEHGSYGKLKSINFESPAIWTSMVTGVVPRSHGIYKHTQSKFPGMKGYVQYPYYLGLNTTIQAHLNKINFHLIKMSIISSHKREVPAIWNILSLKKRKTIVLNWLATHPVEPINGIMISPQIYYYSAKKNKNNVKPYLYSTPILEMPNGLYAEFDLGQLSSDEYFSELALGFLKQDKYYDLFMLYLNRIDVISHTHWEYMEPDKFFSVDKKKIKTYKHSIENTYIKKDEFIGKILENIDGKYSLLICSDHGFGPALFEYKRTGGHANSPDGIFIAHGNIFKKNYRIKNINIYDISPTILHILGFPCARDMPGRVITEAFADQFKNKINYIKTYGIRGRKFLLDKSKTFEEHIELLKSLGYIK